jgi:hypothetical protein
MKMFGRPPRGALTLVCSLLSLAPSSAVAQDCVVIEDFSKGAVGELPPGWKLRKDEGRGVYSIQEEGGKRFLRAVSRGIGIQAAKEFPWDLAKYPVLTWSWRPVEFPAGADERQSKKNDSALAVYAVFPHTSASLESVKYVWSAIVPVGTHLTSSMGQTQVRVLRSGTEGKRRWTDERVNVREDYQKYFKTSETPRPAGIAVLTDADDTKSQAQGDYAVFRACAR